MLSKTNKTLEFDEHSEKLQIRWNVLQFLYEKGGYLRSNPVWVWAN